MSDSRLNVRLLVTKVHKIADWFMLGVHLGVPTEELNKIDQRFSVTHGVERCKAEVFDLWLRRNPSARWNDVAEALEQLNEMTLANELRTISPPLTEQPQAFADAKTKAQEQKLEQKTTVRVELSKVTVRRFTNVESKFASLVSHVKTVIKEKEVAPEKLHSFLEVRLNQKIEFSSSTSISDLFEYIAPYYCFLNTTLLENIINEFLGESLQQQLHKYEILLDEFTSSTKISLLKEINTSTQTKSMPLVVLKLSGRCLDVTIKRFQELIKHIFEEESNALSNIQVKHGCICISWNTRDSAVSSLTVLAKNKIKLMKHIGILRLVVGETTIFDHEQLGLQQENDKDYYLEQSVVSNCIEAVEFLLSAGADPNHRNIDGKTVLGLASVNGFTGMSKLLIDAGACVNHADACSPKMTPLMLACSENHDDLVRLLLQSVADANLAGLNAVNSAINARNGKGLTSLAVACQHGSYEAAKLLIEYGADVQLHTFRKTTPLMIACHNRHEDIAALLLDSQADANLQNNLNKTALMIACWQQLAPTVSLLLSNGADPNQQSNTGWTALMIACTPHPSLELDERVPALLISAGADPNLKNNEDFTALILAVRYRYEAGVKVLLNAQANIDAQDQNGNTALHHAASIGHTVITELLVLILY